MTSGLYIRNIILWLSTTILFFCISGSIKAQVHIHPDDSKEHYDSTIYAKYKPVAYFTGFHSYYPMSAEFIPMKTELFKELLPGCEIPAVDLNPAFYLAWMAYMRNWLFTSAGYSYSINNTQENDSLVSSLNQQSISVGFGYNIFTTQAVVISPNIGLRHTRFRHFTSLKKRRISLDDYLSFGDLDLRVSQFSGSVGVNSTFLIKNSLSVGFYASYLFDLHENTIIRSSKNRITNRIRSPLNDFVLGIGFGFGFHEFNK